MNQTKEKIKKVNEDYVCCDQCLVLVHCCSSGYHDCKEFSENDNNPERCDYLSQDGKECNHIFIRMRAMMHEIYSVLERSCELRKQLKQLAVEEMI